MKPDKTLRKLMTGEEVKIIALGDSLTYGWMSARGYLDYLKIMLLTKYPVHRVSILNKGVPGDTALDGLRRIEQDVTTLSSDLVMVQFGLNDAYTDFSPEDFQKNMESIILTIKQKTDSEILLLTSVALLNPGENRIAQEFYHKIIECGTMYNLPVAAVHQYWEKKISSGIKHTSLVQSDGIHPTEKGYELMAEAVFELF